MMTDFYFGRMAYFFFLICESVVVVIAGLVGDSFSKEYMIGIACYLMLSIMLFKIMSWKNVSERIYCKLQIVYFLILAGNMCYVFDSAYVLFFLIFLQSVLALLFMDKGMSWFQTAASTVVVIAAALMNFPGMSRKPVLLEDIFLLSVLFLTNWLAVNLIGRLKFRDRQNHEQEQSLDDMLKVVEVKCDEARAATRSKSEFLSNMSHEIRTPINAVLGMNEMILRESQDKKILKYAANIESSGNMLLSLINDILDFSKIESGKMEIIPVEYQLSSVLNDLVNMIVPRAKGKQLQLKVEVAPSVPNYLYGDEVRIRQIVTNLLTNAVKYTDKGKVTLEADFKQISDEEINLIFRVRDTGKGIKEEDIDKLFQSFQRVDQKNNRNIEGTGLGLSITSRFIEMMKGEIKVESTYGEGSLFWVSIPQKVMGEEAVGDFKRHFERGMRKSEAYHESFQAPNAKILVVDDNEMNLMVVEGLLKQTRVQIDKASSGMQCLGLLRQKKYDIILLDHMMPAMDGVETLENIKKEGLAAGVPVIALTANAISGAREMYMEYGFQDYLSKPIAGTSLERMLLCWLPKELIESSKEDSETEDRKTEQDVSRKGRIDRNVGIQYSAGSEEVYQTILQAYWKQGEKYLAGGKKYLEEEAWQDYRRIAHDIKSTSLSIGATALSEEAKQQEMAAKDGRVDEIREKGRALLEHYKEVLDEVKEMLEE